MDTARKYEKFWTEFNDFLEAYNLEGRYSSEQIVLYLSWLEYLITSQAPSLHVLMVFTSF